MLLLLVAVVAGLLAGRLRRALAVHALRPRLRHWWLVLPAAGLRAVAEVVDAEDPAVLAVAGSLVVLVVLAAANRHLVGALVIALGVLSNLAAVAIHGGMPVRPEALVDAGIVEAAELPTVELAPWRHLESRSDPVPELGDIIPIPQSEEVVSFGDVVVAVGLFDVLSELTRRRRRPPGARSAEPEGDVATGYGGDATTAANVAHDWGAAPSPAPESGSQYSA